MKTNIAELEQISHSANQGLVVNYLNDRGGVWHFHPEYEIMLNLKNNGTRIIGDNVEIFDEYELIFIAGNIPHCWNYYKIEGHLPDNHGIIVHFLPEFFGDGLMNQPEMGRIRELFAEAERGIAFSVQDARNAEKFLKDMIQHSGIEKIIDLFQVLGMMSRSSHRRPLCTQNYKIEYDRLANKRMANVYNYLRENYNKPISLKDICVIAGMKPLSFSKYFKKSTGTSYIEYLHQLRINRACYLLRETFETIHNIAKECGFSSLSNFNKQFKKNTGVSPRIFRLQHNI